VASLAVAGRLDQQDFTEGVVLVSVASDGVEDLQEPFGRGKFAGKWFGLVVRL